MEVDFRQGTIDDIEAISELSRAMWFEQAAGSSVPAAGQTVGSLTSGVGPVVPTGLSDLIARNDTLQLFAQATYAEVALAGGRVVGAVLARVDQDSRPGQSSVVHAQAGQPALAGSGLTSPPTDRLTQQLADTRRQLADTPEGRQFLAEMESDLADTEQLEEFVRQGTQAELLLFILGAQARGQGVGSRLFKHFLTHLRSRGVESYYLYTDTKCDYGFYDHHGLRRVAESRGRTSPGGGQFDKFVYQGWLRRADSQTAAETAGLAG